MVVGEGDVPFLGLNLSLCNNSTAGTRKARVFPDPVLAAPSTSFPAKSGGMALACTGVIVVNPISAIAFVVGSESSSVENGWRSWSVGEAEAAGAALLALASAVIFVVGLLVAQV